MTVAFDAVFAADEVTTASPRDVTHTPVGTPRAIVALINHGTTASDVMTGVTYGGVAMTRVPTNGFAADTLGEPGAVYAYFLGASIPTGVQTVSFSYTGTDSKSLLSLSFTAAADCEIVVSGKLEGDQTNPQISLDTGATESLRVALLYSGFLSAGSLTPLSGQTVIRNVDYGSFVALATRRDAAVSGAETIGWTAASDDVAMTAVAIQEISAAGAADPYPYVDGGYYPTQG